MFRGRFLGVILTLLLVVGLFGLASNSIYRSGWSEGYVAGQVSSSTEGAEGAAAEAAPVNPYYRHGRYGGPGGFFGLFGGILKFFLFFLFLGMIFKFVGFLFFWRKGGWGSGWGPRGRGMHKHGHHGHRGYNPPWYEEGEDGEEPVMKA